MKSTTTFVGSRKTLHNAVDRSGHRYGTVVLGRQGFHGNRFGTCAVCQTETLFTKAQIRREKIRCPHGCKA